VLFGEKRSPPRSFCAPPMNALSSRELFGCDPWAPLRVTTVTRERRDGVVIEVVRYDHGARGDAEAYLDAPRRGVDVLATPGASSFGYFGHRFGGNDEIISEAQARALYDAAAEPKRWAEYDCGHTLDAGPAARADRFAFFESELPA
jgi:hypothetical protein